MEVKCDTANFKFSLSFDRKENTNLKIEAANRDLALLLLSDVKEYLQTEILIFRTFSFEENKIGGQLFPIIAMLFMLLTLVFSFNANLTPDALKQLLSSQDNSEKLNYLVQHTQTTGISNRIWIIFAGSILMMLILIFIGSFLDKVFPRNIFNIGKEKNRYERIVQRRANSMWGIIIAFIVPLLAVYWSGI